MKKNSGINSRIRSRYNKSVLAMPVFAGVYLNDLVFIALGSFLVSRFTKKSSPEIQQVALIASLILGYSVCLLKTHVLPKDFFFMKSRKILFGRRNKMIYARIEK